MNENFRLCSPTGDDSPSVGAGGWSKLVLAAGDEVPAALASWIRESYALMAGAPAGAKKQAKRR